MVDPQTPLVFDTAFAPRIGEAVPVIDGVVRVTAPNAGPYTFTGTNSFIIGKERVAVLDPGPDDSAHRDALLAAIAGRRVEAILLTHTHRDHSDGAAPLAKLTGAPLWFGGPHRLSRAPRMLEINLLKRQGDWALQPDRALFDGEQFEIGGVGLTAITTPGHCANHLAFGIAGDEWLLTGDHIMGWNSTLVAVPDGSMAEYLDSMRKVIALPYRHYIPAHGGPIDNGPGYARALLDHRLLRNRQIVEAVEAGVRTIAGLLDRMYPTLKAGLRMAAHMTLSAHIEYLADRGEIRARRTPLGVRLSPRAG
jgi:glyoxylase-like metal-dependent hydrolase (beta-lactamase superfamily II)